MLRKGELKLKYILEVVKNISCNLLIFCGYRQSWGYFHKIIQLQETDCIECFLGHYCQGYGNVVPTGPCDAGYYCISGQDTPTPDMYNCSQGHYCPEGSHEELRCPSGTYQDETAQGACKPCPAGYFCNNMLDPVVLYGSSLCPKGGNLKNTLVNQLL